MPRHRQLFFSLGVAALSLSLMLAGSLNARAGEDPPAHTYAETAEAKAKVLAGSHGDSSHQATHEPAGEPNILEPQPSLALWTVAVFLGLLFVLGKFAWEPLLKSLHHREEHLLNVLHETERARNEGEALLAEHRRQLQAAEDQIRAMLDEGRKNAQALADDISKKAQAEAEATRERAQRDINTARDQALSEIWSKTADLAVSVAAKVLDKSITGDDHRRLIETAMSALPASASQGSTNGHGA